MLFLIGDQTGNRRVPGIDHRRLHTHGSIYGYKYKYKYKYFYLESVFTNRDDLACLYFLYIYTPRLYIYIVDKEVNLISKINLMGMQTPVNRQTRMMRATR